MRGALINTMVSNISLLHFVEMMVDSYVAQESASLNKQRKLLYAEYLLKYLCRQIEFSEVLVSEGS